METITEDLLNAVYKIENNKYSFLEIKSEIIMLIENSNDVKYGEYYYDSYSDAGWSHPLLSYVCYKIMHNSMDDTKRFEQYSQIAEILILNGANVGIKDAMGYTSLDYLLMCDKNGVNVSTYRLCMIMITSLSKKNMNHYLLHCKNDNTFPMLENLLKIFGKYDKHIEYMF